MQGFVNIPHKQAFDVVMLAFLEGVSCISALVPLSSSLSDVIQLKVIFICLVITAC